MNYVIFYVFICITAVCGVANADFYDCTSKELKQYADSVRDNCLKTAADGNYDGANNKCKQNPQTDTKEFCECVHENALQKHETVKYCSVY